MAWTLPSSSNRRSRDNPVVLEATNPLTSWTVFDPSSIGNGIAGVHGKQQNIQFSIDTPATVSASPDAMYGVYGALTAADGDVQSWLDHTALWAMHLIEGSLDLSGFVDVHAMLVAYNDGSTGGTAAPTSGMEGWGVGLLYNSTDGVWQVTNWGNAGVGWSYNTSPGNNTDDNTEGVYGWFGRAQSQSGTRAASLCLDAGLHRNGLSNDNTTDNSTTIADGPLNSVAMGIGWETGSGGSACSVKLHGAVTAIDLTNRLDVVLG